MNVHITSPENLDLSFINITPGDWVVLKPNFVKENKENDPNEWESVVTSPWLIRTVCEYVCKNLNSKGKVTICDAPQTDSSFSKIAERTGLYQIALECKEKYKVEVEIIDLRSEEWTNVGGIITERKKLKGDPNGVIAFSLGKHSLFYGYKGEGKYYGADYDETSINEHHQGEIQEYLICATPILADVFINLPKLKTHKKTGVTLSLKNLVGINADKNWLPHHTAGSPENGGDQYAESSLKRKLEQLAVRFARTLSLKIPIIGSKLAIQLRKAGTKTFGSTQKVIRSGNWYGNDTTWRMALDLNWCLFYGNGDGTFKSVSTKRYYSLLDGIIGMEGDGPMQGDPIHTNLVITGTDPVAVDMVAARVMGFDWRKIPVIREALNLKSMPITNVRSEEIEVFSDNPEWNGNFLEIEKKEFYKFRPHFGWKNKIENEPR